MLERQVVIPANPEQLWTALTDPEAVAQWFGSVVEWDLRPGGDANFREEDGSVRRGVIDAVSPGRHLSFRWWREDDDETVASQVTYTLEPEAEGTRLTVTEQPVPAGAGAPSANGDRWTTWDSRLFRCWADSALVCRASR